MIFSYGAAQTIHLTSLSDCTYVQWPGEMAVSWAPTPADELEPRYDRKVQAQWFREFLNSLGEKKPYHCPAMSNSLPSSPVRASCRSQLLSAEWKLKSWKQAN